MSSASSASGNKPLIDSNRERCSVSRWIVNGYVDLPGAEIRPAEARRRCLEVDPACDTRTHVYCDCDGADPQVWSVPGVVASLVAEPSGVPGGVRLRWAPTPEPGGATPAAYDLLRSSSAADFLQAGQCLEAGDADLEGADDEPLDAGGLRFYLVRAVSTCGPGGVGTGTAGGPRPALLCP